MVAKGAFADLLLIDGNSLEGITVIGGGELWLQVLHPQPVSAFRWIMSGGQIYLHADGYSGAPYRRGP